MSPRITRTDVLCERVRLAAPHLALPNQGPARRLLTGPPSRASACHSNRRRDACQPLNRRDSGKQRFLSIPSDEASPSLAVRVPPRTSSIRQARQLLYSDTALLGTAGSGRASTSLTASKVVALPANGSAASRPLLGSEDSEVAVLLRPGDVATLASWPKARKTERSPRSWRP